MYSKMPTKPKICIFFRFGWPTIWKEKYILGRISLYFWGYGGSWLYFKDLESKGKYFQGAEEFSFRDLGRSMHYFQGWREHRLPLGGGGGGRAQLFAYNESKCLLRFFTAWVYVAFLRFLHIDKILPKTAALWIQFQFFTCMPRFLTCQLHKFYSWWIRIFKCKWAVACDFQQCGILTCVDSDEPLQPPFKLKNSKWCLVSS